MKSETSLERARKLAQRYLRYGSRSTAELTAHLAARDLPPDLLRETVEFCARKSWLDDRLCAKLVATSLADEGFAWAAIRERLAQKGFAASLIETTLEPLRRESSDEAQARKLLEREQARRQPRGRRHIAGVLARHGFDAELIEQVVGSE